MRSGRPYGVAVVAALAAAASLVAAEREPRVVMISIDGLMPSSYTRPGPSKIPVIRRLMADGAYADGVEGVLPTVTYPSHTTLITGVTPAVHGIVDNQMFDPENKSGGANYWYARDIHVPTLPGAVRGRGWRTGAVSWPVTVGMEIDYHVPEFWRPGSSADYPESASFLRAVSTPRLLDAVEIARGTPLAFKQTDEDRTDIAAYILKTYQPHLMLVHLLDLDSAQHTYGPGSREALEALERLDGQIGTLIDAAQGAGMAERPYIAVVSDHGFLPVERQLNPNALFKQQHLLTVDGGGRITSWKAAFHSSGGSGYVYLNDRRDRALRDRVWALLQSAKADHANGIESLWDADDLARLGGPPDAAFGFDMRPGFYTGEDTGPLLVATARGEGGGTRGGHGHSPLRPELRSSFVVTGPALPAHGSLGVIRMTQIAPTLARWLGVGLSPMADGPIDAVVAPVASTAHARD